MLPGSPDVRDTERRRTTRGLRRRAWRTTLLFGAVALLVAVAADRWHAGVRRADARAQVRSQMSPPVGALRAALDRRLGLLAGLQSFTESRRSRAQLEEEFALYAQGTLAGNPGVEIMELLQDDRIALIWPLRGNEVRIGFKIGAIDPWNRAALNEGRALVTGPVDLREGGRGVLLRQALKPRAGFPEMATLILDVPSLVREAGIPDASSNLRLELHRRGVGWFGGDPLGSAVEPESIAITGDRFEWDLLGAPVAGWASLSAARARDFRLAAGSFVAMFAFLGFLVGGREQRLAEEVEERGSQLALALRAGHMGVWEWDLATNAIECSPAVGAILGWDPATEPRPGERFFGLLAPDDRPRVHGLVDALRAGLPAGNVLECRIEHPDGAPRWILSINEAVRDEAGRPERVFGVLSDFTERRGLEDRLRHSQRLEAVGQLAGGIAHDFNNLLTALIGFTELAIDQADQLPGDQRAAAIREDLEQVMATANRAADLTGQLLAFSRRSSTRPSLVNLSHSVRELEPMLGRLLTARVDLRTALEADVPEVWVDPGQLTQVIMNLVVNARDAMPDGGTIWVRTRRLRPTDPLRPGNAPAGELACLEVTDSGVGISDETRQRIFEPYFTTKEMGRGTGLGLAEPGRQHLQIFAVDWRYKRARQLFFHRVHYGIAMVLHVLHSVAHFFRGQLGG